MSNEIFHRYRKQIILGVIGVFILIVALSIFTYVSRIGKVGVTFSIVPGDAQLLIDGRASGKGTQWLTPGTYLIKVAKDGFTPTERRVVVTGEKAHNVVAVSLTPESAEAKKWADTHQQQYKDNEEFGSIEAQETGQYLRNKHPIISVLPYQDPYYQIAYTLNKDQSITLTIDTPSPRYRYFAVQKIRELGYDPTDYVIEFEQFSNPLKGTNE